MHIELEGELSHIATVQTWECDSNAHLNVQFFHQRFREAGYFFRQKHGLDGTPMATAHTRFYRELHADDTARVLTLPVYDTAGTFYLMHRLTVDGMAPACISLDRLDGDPATLSTQIKLLNAQPLAHFPMAGPRGLVAGHERPPADTDQLIAAAQADVTSIAQVLQNDLDHAGIWRAERVISSFSNGGQSAWTLVGGTNERLHALNLGRVVLELKYKQMASPAAGTILRQTSYPLALNEKTYRFCHQIEDAVSGQVYALGETLSVLMDLSARKVVALPTGISLPKGMG